MQTYEITNNLSSRMIGFRFLRARVWRNSIFISFFANKGCFTKIFDSSRTRLLNPIILVKYNVSKTSKLFILVARILLGQQDSAIKREVLV